MNEMLQKAIFALPEKIGQIEYRAMPDAASNKDDYLKKLKLAIQQRHQCEATYRRSVSVHEKNKGKTIWKGDVEIFWLTGHPRAKRCYAWSRGWENGRENLEIILELPPVIGAATAVRAALSKPR